MSEDEKTPLTILVDQNTASRLQKDGKVEVALRRDDKCFEDFLNCDIADDEGNNASVTVDKGMSREEFELKCREIERDEAISRNNAITDGIELAASILNFIAEHPKIIEAGEKAVHFLKNKGGILISKIKDHTLNKGKENIVETTELDSYTEVIDDNAECREISIEEARSNAIAILADYIDMKKRVDLLSKAEINGNNKQSLEFDEVISHLNSYVKIHPELMDMPTTFSIQYL